MKYLVSDFNDLLRKEDPGQRKNADSNTPPKLSTRMSVIIPLLKFIARKKYYFVFLILVVSTTIYILNKRSQYYESKIVLNLNSAKVSGSVVNDDQSIRTTVQNSASMKRIGQIIYSDKMTSLLEHKFDLMNVYSLNENKYYSLHNILKENISVRADQYDAITISVKDKTDNQRATAMANFISEEIVVLNQQLYAEQLKQRLAIDSIVYGHLISNVDNEKRFINEKLELAKGLLFHGDFHTSQSTLNLVSTLNNSILRFDEYSQKYFDKLNENISLQTTLNEKYFIDLMILKKAIPEAKVNAFNPLLLWPAILIISFCLSIALFFFIFQINILLKEVKESYSIIKV